MDRVLTFTSEQDDSALVSLSSVEYLGAPSVRAGIGMEVERLTISCILSMTNCMDHSKLVISIVSEPLPVRLGISTCRVFPMDREMSTRNMVTVYCLNLG